MKETDLSSAVNELMAETLRPVSFAGSTQKGLLKDIKNKKNRYNVLKAYEKELPAVTFVINQAINYLLSDELTFEDDKDTKKFKEFLSRENVQDESNEYVLREALYNYFLYGHSGLRFLSAEDGWVLVKYNKYGKLIAPSKTHSNVSIPLGYLIADREDVQINRDWEVIKYYGDADINGSVVTFSVVGENSEPLVFTQDSDEVTSDVVLNDGQYTLIPAKEFVHFSRGGLRDYRNRSPLLKDKGRLEFLLVLLRRLRYDVEYNGLGTLAITIDTDVLKNLTTENGVSSSQLIKSGPTARQVQDEEVKQLMDELIRKVQSASQNDTVTLTSNMNLQQLVRDTKASEFISTIHTYANQWVAEALGISPKLLQMQQTSSDRSASSVLNNEMRNSILPMKQSLFTRLKPVLREGLDINSALVFDVPEYLSSNDTMQDWYGMQVWHDLAENVGEEEASSYLKDNITGTMPTFKKLRPPAVAPEDTTSQSSGMQDQENITRPNLKET